MSVLRPAPRAYSFPSAALAIAVALAAIMALAAPTPAAAQSFGAAAYVDGDVVGFAEPASRMRPGAIRLYAAGDDGRWSEMATLGAPDGAPADGFGASIARDGDRLLVGAPGIDERRGAAYLFERRDGRWVETEKLTVEGAEPGAEYGTSVALEGDLAFLARDDGRILSMAGMVESMIGPAQTERLPGEVRAFRRGAAGVWRDAGGMTLESGATGIGFGEALAVRDETVFVGAASDAGRRGTVYAFRPASAGGWELAWEIAGPEPNGGFGAALAIDDDGRLIVGAPTLGGQIGAVIVMRHGEGEPWTEAQRLTGQGDAHVGSSVAVSGDELWAGSLRAGFSFRLQADEGEYGDRVAHAVERDAQTEFFGTEVAVGEGLAAIGFPDDDFGAGTGAVFARTDEGDWAVAATVSGEVDAMAAVTGDEVRCEDGNAAQFDCGQVDLLAFVPRESVGAGRGVMVNDLWGWTDPDTGREYVIIGRGDGTAFVDVTDASSPVYVANLPRTPGTPESLWRDIKTIGNYALIVSDNAGPHGMQIFDMTRLRGLSGFPAVVEPDTVYSEIHSAHNLVVNEEAGMAYAAGGSGGGEACGGGMHAIDVRDPMAPTFAGCVSYSEPNNPMAGLTHDSQCVVYHGPDVEHQGKQICMNSNFAGVTIVDVTDASAPVTLAVGKYPGSALPHQGWLTEDHQYFLHGDEGDEIQGLVGRTRTLVWDVTDLDDPVVGGEYLAPTAEIDHNQYVKGDLAYQANYGAGLRILDISDPEQPVEVGFFDTMPYGPGEPAFDGGAWSVFPYFESGTIAISSATEGLFLVRYSPAEQPTS